MNEVHDDKDEKVIVRRRIVDSLCVLTTSEYGWFANMERIMKARALRDNSVTSHMASERTMEVNPTHFITKELKKKALADKSFDGEGFDLAPFRLLSCLQASAWTSQRSLRNAFTA